MTERWYPRLLAPMGVDEFEREYYERRLCHVVRDDAGYYDDLLTARDLDTVLGSHAVRHPDISLVEGEADLPPDGYTNDAGRIQPLEIARGFDGGATVVFRQLHNRVPALAALCTDLGRHLSSRVQTNIYLTPPHARGFIPHWDTHDVFVLQIAGRKQWAIYGTPVELPLRGQKFEPGGPPPGEPTAEFELTAGSVAYLPRGLMHDARATDDISLHVTLGLTAFTWADFLTESVSAAALDDPALRENLPLGFARPEFDAATRERVYREKLESVVERLDVSAVWQRFEDEVATTNGPLYLDLLGRRLHPSDLAPDTVVRHRPGLALEPHRSETDCRLRFAGQELTLPVAVWPAVEYVATHETFRVDALPDCLDTDGKLTLVRRLVREGALQPRA